jgi:hypothetical protein
MMRGFLLSLFLVLGSLRNLHCFAPSPVTQRGPHTELRAGRQEHEDAALSRRIFTKIGILLAVASLQVKLLLLLLTIWQQQSG